MNAIVCRLCPFDSFESKAWTRKKNRSKNNGIIQLAHSSTPIQRRLSFNVVPLSTVGYTLFSVCLPPAPGNLIHINVNGLRAPCQHYKHIKRRCDPVSHLSMYVYCTQAAASRTRHTRKEKYVYKRSQLTVHIRAHAIYVLHAARPYVWMCAQPARVCVYVRRRYACVSIDCAHRIHKLFASHTRNQALFVWKNISTFYDDIQTENIGFYHCVEVIQEIILKNDKHGNATKFRTHFRACQDTVSFKKKFFVFIFENIL